MVSYNVSRADFKPVPAGCDRFTKPLLVIGYENLGRCTPVIPVCKNKKTVLHKSVLYDDNITVERSRTFA